MLGDVFYRGALVRRYSLLRIQHNAAILPRPTPRLQPGASWGTGNYVNGKPDNLDQVVTELEVNFARLVHDLDNHQSAHFDGWLAASEFVVEPG